METTSLLNGEGTVDERSPLTEVFDGKELNDSAVLVDVLGRDTKLSVLLSVTAIVVGISASTTVTSVSFRLPLLLSSDSFIISLVISESSRTSIFSLQVTLLASRNFSTSEEINPFELLSAFLTLSCTSSAKL